MALPTYGTVAEPLPPESREIAVANSPLWIEITDQIDLTTTSVCKQELERHAENTRETAREGSVRTGFIAGVVPRSMRPRTAKYRSPR